MKEISYAAPGPWKVLSDGRIVSEHPECRSSIAQVYSMNDWAEGNAHLIRAAPELLEALEIVEPVIDAMTASVEPGRMIRAAIKKARGEE